MTTERIKVLEAELEREFKTSHGLRAQVERLKMASDSTQYCTGEFPCEASTAAAYLEKERDKLRVNLAELEIAYEQLREAREAELGVYERHCDIVRNLRAKCERLEGVLREVADTELSSTWDRHGRWSQVTAKARAALTDPEQEGE